MASPPLTLTPPDPGTTLSSQDPCDGFLTGPPLPSLHPSQFSTQLLGCLPKVSETLLLSSSKPTPLTQTGSWRPFHGPRTPPDLTLASPCDFIADQPPLARLCWLHPLLSLEQPCTRPPQGLCTCCSSCRNAPSPHISTAYSLTPFTSLPNSSFS